MSARTTEDPTKKAGWGATAKRLGGRLALGLVALLVAGALFEQIGAWRDARRYPDVGERIAVGGGRKMYLDCRGTGAPTVLLEAGHDSWSPA